MSWRDVLSTRNQHQCNLCRISERWRLCQSWSIWWRILEESLMSTRAWRIFLTGCWWERDLSGRCFRCCGRDVPLNLHWMICTICIERRASEGVSLDVEDRLIWSRWLLVLHYCKLSKETVVMEQYLIFYRTILGDGYIWKGKVLQYLYLLEPITYCTGSHLYYWCFVCWFSTLVQVLSYQIV